MLILRYVDFSQSIFRLKYMFKENQMYFLKLKEEIRIHTIFHHPVISIVTTARD